MKHGLNEIEEVPFDDEILSLEREGGARGPLARSTLNF